MLVFTDVPRQAYTSAQPYRPGMAEIGDVTPRLFCSVQTGTSDGVLPVYCDHVASHYLTADCHAGLAVCYRHYDSVQAVTYNGTTTLHPTR